MDAFEQVSSELLSDPVPMCTPRSIPEACQTISNLVFVLRFVSIGQRDGVLSAQQGAAALDAAVRGMHTELDSESALQELKVLFSRESASAR